MPRRSSYVETPSSISTDLTAIRSTGDGKLDEVHTLRSQHGADIVTLIGSGYASSGYCGIGGLMTSVSTSFASSAFNVVDRTCAVGNLSYAHELGHNQGLHHDPANAGSTPSYPYAYGYRDPSGVLPHGPLVRGSDADRLPVEPERLLQHTPDWHIQPGQRAGAERQRGDRGRLQERRGHDDTDDPDGVQLLRLDDLAVLLVQRWVEIGVGDRPHGVRLEHGQ